jgi:hypothetical protein
MGQRHQARRGNPRVVMKRSRNPLSGTAWASSAPHSHEHDFGARAQTDHLLGDRDSG